MARLAFAVLCCTACIGIGAHAQDTKPESSLTANPVYQKNCAKCHGKSASGHFMAGPSLTSAKATTMSAEELRAIVTNGKHHMPKFEGKLQPSEIDTLVEQIRSESKQQ
ncbi:MAG TPA: cytochrome c [Candidatus Binatia bacterium]|nr:cytochrome c [Candidatus Binatia bacterium]